MFFITHDNYGWLWLNGWVFLCELTGCGFESCCSHINFSYRACFEQWVPWLSGNYRVWIHSKTRTWHDQNIQLSKRYLPASKKPPRMVSERCSIFGTNYIMEQHILLTLWWNDEISLVTKMSVAGFFQSNLRWLHSQSGWCFDFYKKKKKW